MEGFVVGDTLGNLQVWPGKKKSVLPLRILEKLGHYPSGSYSLIPYSSHLFMIKKKKKRSCLIVSLQVGGEQRSGCGWGVCDPHSPAEQKLFKSLESLHCSINTLILRVRKRNSECLNDLPNFTRCWSQDLDTHIGLMQRLMPSPPYHAVSQTYTREELTQTGQVENCLKVKRSLTCNKHLINAFISLNEKVN